DERLVFMQQDSQSSLLITEQRFISRFSGMAASVRLVDPLDVEISRQRVSSPQIEVGADNVACVIYTSGSTGRPKGVLALHRGAVNRFNWMWQIYPFAAGEVC